MQALQSNFKIALALGFLGLLDSGYLTWKHYEGGSVACSIVTGCDRVLSSAYASIAGIPVALLGVFFYSAVILVSLALVHRERTWALRLLFGLGSLGLLASIRFFYLQAFVLEAFCTYCLVSGAVTVLIFLFAILYNKRRAHEALTG